MRCTVKNYMNIKKDSNQKSKSVNFYKYYILNLYKGEF